jgi:MATE family multidrug resistance protein
MVATLVLAAPIVVTQIAHISMGFVDTLMVGRLGPAALAGVALGNTLFFTMTLFCMGIVMAVGPMVSQAFGAGEGDPIGRSVRQGIWLSLALSIPAGILIWNGGYFLHVLGQRPETIELAVSYLHAIVWGVFAFIGFAALRGFCEAVSRPRPVTLIALTGVGVNVLGNYVLMYGRWGFPELGLVGTGWASTIAFWTNFLLITGYVLFNRDFSGYHIFSRLGRPDLSYFKQLLRIGAPIGASMAIEMSLFMTAVMMMGWIGMNQLAAHQVAIQCAAFTFMVPLGIGMATSVRVGHAAGARDNDGVFRAGLAGIILSVSFMSIAAVIFWVAPKPVISLYLDMQATVNAPVIEIAVKLLGIAAIFQVFDGLQVAGMGALRGLKDTRRPMMLAMIAYWPIGLTTSYVLAFPLGLNEVGLWWGLVVGLASASIMISIRFYRLASDSNTYFGYSVIN